MMRPYIFGDGDYQKNRAEDDKIMHDAAEAEKEKKMQAAMQEAKEMDARIVNPHAPDRGMVLELGPDTKEDWCPVCGVACKSKEAVLSHKCKDATYKSRQYSEPPEDELPLNAVPQHGDYALQDWHHKLLEC